MSYVCIYVVVVVCIVFAFVQCIESGCAMFVYL